MPTITVIKEDLERLAGQTYTMPDLEKALEYAKAEVKVDDTDGKLRVQLKDTNRPDLWSSEGLARQLKGHRENQHPNYTFFNTASTERELHVDPQLENIRPYIAAFACEGILIDEAALEQLIEAQEKLADGYGRGRSTVAIGIYDASTIQYPIQYQAVDPDTTTFIPLEFETELTLRQILKDHPTGEKYAHLLKDFDKFPIIRDAKNEVLSMPPVINSQTLGRVEVGNTHLFCEATGTELDSVLLTIAILAANMADRGGTIYPVTIKYPYDTPRGREIYSPTDLTERVNVDTAEIHRLIGTDISAQDIETSLNAMGYRNVSVKGTQVSAQPAPYRDDILHPVDIIEDVIISIGYESFEPEMPKDFTIGKAAPIEDLSDRFRNLMVGCGFQEIFSAILGSREEQTTQMCNPDAKIVEISNPMSEYYSCVRASLLPGLLRVENTSRRAKYPHRTFEVGDVSVIDPEHNYGTRTDILLCALESGEDANLSNIQSYLEALAYHLHIDYTLRPIDHPSFLSGRAGEICVNDKAYGLIGEIHPAVLDNWGIAAPTSIFEININIAE
ncbi:MAG: phenylalanyl-tRNA synthetase beta chain [Candidatus Latescibacterota bacterium]|jgi:phenylalanyl-tRNA synthetase beta chain